MVDRENELRDLRVSPVRKHDHSLVVSSVVQRCTRWNCAELWQTLAPPLFGFAGCASGRAARSEAAIGVRPPVAPQLTRGRERTFGSPSRPALRTERFSEAGYRSPDLD
jgi:hypothetical protein